jgi:hypothetical protein
VGINIKCIKSKPYAGTIRLIIAIFKVEAELSFTTCTC